MRLSLDANCSTARVLLPGVGAVEMPIQVLIWLSLGLGLLLYVVSLMPNMAVTLAQPWWERGEMPYSVSSDARCGVDPRPWEAHVRLLIGASRGLRLGDCRAKWSVLCGNMPFGWSRKSAQAL